MLDHIAYAQENPTEYRIMFLSERPRAKNRQEMVDDNPAFRVLFKCVRSCLEAGVLRGDAFGISTIVLTAIHGAASLLITIPDFPFGSRRQFAEEVIATILSGLQDRAIPAI